MEELRFPKVSVIIPVYNAEEYLRECLDSVVNQTLRDIEIICVDDGSTDGSLSVLREYEKGDPRVRVFTQPNINAGAARNKGLYNATGEYLSFL
ncbi:MAG: glycosyltransferase family 2 protein, partial [Oscillospiraceae bacterium]|nr:glycosyltransferase family 2 protein [Oscillospiraceae bacterium]